MRADARKRCRYAPKNAFIPRTSAGLDHVNSPRTTQTAEKEKKARTGTAILFLRRKRAADEMSRRVEFQKKRRATPYSKKAYLYRGADIKNFKILCQNCVASLFLFDFSCILCRSGP